MDPNFLSLISEAPDQSAQVGHIILKHCGNITHVDNIQLFEDEIMLNSETKEEFTAKQMTNCEDRQKDTTLVRCIRLGAASLSVDEIRKFIEKSDGEDMTIRSYQPSTFFIGNNDTTCVMYIGLQEFYNSELMYLGSIIMLTAGNFNVDDTNSTNIKRNYKTLTENNSVLKRGAALYWAKTLCDANRDDLYNDYLASWAADGVTRIHESPYFHKIRSQTRPATFIAQPSASRHRSLDRRLDR